MMESSSENLDCATWATALKSRIGELQQQSSQDFKKNRNAGKRQLDTIRSNLAKIVDDLQVREKDLADAQSALLQKTAEIEVLRETTSSIESIVQESIAHVCDPIKSLESLAQAIQQDISNQLTSELQEKLASGLAAASSQDNSEAVKRSLADIEKRVSSVHETLSSHLPIEIALAIESSLDKHSKANTSATLLTSISEEIDQLTRLVEAAQKSIVSQVPAAILPLIETNFAQLTPSKLESIVEERIAQNTQQIEERLNQVRDAILKQLPESLAPLVANSHDTTLSNELAEILETQVADNTKRIETLLNQTRDAIIEQVPEILLPLLEQGHTPATSEELAIVITSRLAESTKHIEQLLQEACDSIASQVRAPEDNSHTLRELTELIDSMRQRQTELDAQRLESVERMNAAERLFDRTAMQRKSVARSLRLKQRLLRSEAERIKQTQSADTSDQSQLQELLARTQENCEQLRSELADSKSRIEALNVELTTSKRSLATAQNVAEKSKAEVAVLQAQLADCEALLEDSIEGSTSGSRRTVRDNDLENRLAEALAAQQKLENQLADAQHALNETCRSEQNSDEAELIAQLRREVADLQELLAEASRPREHGPAGEDPALENQLRRAEVELNDLRSQNSDLASQIAKLQICIRQNHEPQPHLSSDNLSWEDRKKLMLMQLEAECIDESPQTVEKKSEIEAIIARTDAEVNRRDREIAELRALLEEQSNARDGIAIGAAAIAELIETDELVQLEREKLRTIQQEWDQKLRQAEIEFSMERARLGRDRAQLEEKLRALEASLPSAGKTETEKSEKSSGRRWLDRLGLKEDK